MEKYQENGITKYRGVTDETPMSALEFSEDEAPGAQPAGCTIKLHSLRTNLGRVTVLIRTHNESGAESYESGYRDTEGRFWVASHLDVREGGTFGDTVRWVKGLADHGA